MSTHCFQQLYIMLYLLPLMVVLTPIMPVFCFITGKFDWNSHFHCNDSDLHYKCVYGLVTGEMDKFFTSRDNNN